MATSNDDTDTFTVEAGNAPTAASPEMEAEGERRTNARLSPGTCVGRYTIQSFLGAGGMGEVYLAVDPELERSVAVKLLRSQPGATTARARFRFLREGKAMARLSHPNVLTVYDVGTFGERMFVAMELIEGENLASWMRARRRPWREVRDAFVKAGRGLAAAHEAGIVHRDFKPGNVLLGNDRVVVADFGVARADAGPESLEDSDEPPRMSILGAGVTRTGEMLGTPQYFSPEQFAGRPATALSDQFSFCVSLFEALYGELPSHGATFEELAAATRAGEIRFPSGDAPRFLVRLLRRGLSRDPADRYPSMHALLVDLERDPGRTARRGLLAAGAVAIVAAAAVGVVPRGRPAPCAGAAARLADVWNDGRRESIRAAFAATHHPNATATFERTEQALSSYGRAWAAMRTETCEATAVRHEQSGELLDLRMACLDGRLAEMDALARVFAGPADRETIDNAVRAAGRLTPMAGCAAPDALRALVPPPSDPTRRARADALRPRLYGVEALVRTGKTAAAADLTAQLVDEAQAIGDPSLLAFALQVRGFLEQQRSDFSAAVATLFKAAEAAADAKDDVRAASIWTSLMVALGRDRERAADAGKLAPAARNAIRRAGNDPRLLGTLERSLGMAALATAKLADARVHLQTALSILTADGYAVERADALLSLANLTRQEGHQDEALARLAEAREIYEKQLGGESKAIANIDYTRSVILVRLGRCAEAAALGESALALAVRMTGPGDPELYLDHMSLGDAYACLKNVAAARASFARALAIAERGEPDSIRLANTLVRFGLGLMLLEQNQEAIEPLVRGLAIAEKRGDAIIVGMALNLLGQAEQALGHHRQAERWLQRGVDHYQKIAGRADLASVLAILSKSQLALGRREQAAASCERSLAIYAEEKLLRDDPFTACESLLARARPRRP